MKYSWKEPGFEVIVTIKKNWIMDSCYVTIFRIIKNINDNSFAFKIGETTVVDSKALVPLIDPSDTLKDLL